MTRKPKITVEKLRERLWIAKLDGVPLKIGPVKADVIEQARFAFKFGDGLLTATFRATAERLKRLSSSSLLQDFAGPPPQP